MTLLFLTKKHLFQNTNFIFFILAPVICGWIACLINLSLCQSWVPSQWKIAIIQPVPNTKDPQQPSEYRTISVLPILSLLVERLVVNNFIYPALQLSAISASIGDQYAFKPTVRQRQQ